MKLIESLLRHHIRSKGQAMTMKKALLLAALLATVMMAVAVADKAEDKEPKDKAPKVAEEQNPPARSKRAVRVVDSSGSSCLRLFSPYPLPLLT